MPWPLLERLLETQAEAIRVKSQALRPILGICAGAWTTGTLLMLLGSGWVPIFGGTIIAVTLLAALVAYGYFAVTEPDRLGSEAHVDRSRLHKAIERAKNPKMIDVAALLTSNAAAPRKRADKEQAALAPAPGEDDDDGT